MSLQAHIDNHAFKLLHYHTVSSAAISLLQSKSELEREAIYHRAIAKNRSLSPASSIEGQLEILDGQVDLEVEGDEDVFIKAMAASSALALYQIIKVPQDQFQEAMNLYDKLRGESETSTTHTNTSSENESAIPKNLVTRSGNNLTPTEVDELFKQMLNLSSQLYTQTYSKKLHEERRINFCVRGVRTTPQGLEFSVDFVGRASPYQVGATQLREILLDSILA